MEATIRQPVRKIVEGHERAGAAIEKVNAKIAPGAFLGFGLGCCVASSVLALTKREHAALLVSSWGSIALLMGLYSLTERTH